MLRMSIYWIALVPVGLTLSLAGLLLNLLSIFTWAKISRCPPTRNTGLTAISFISLGAIDALTLVFFILSDSLEAAFPWVDETYVYAVFYSYVGYPMNYFCLVGGIWIVVIITYDRYTLITKNRGTKASFVVLRTIALLVLVFIVNIPHFFNYRPVKIIELNGSREFYTYEATEYGSSYACEQFEFWFHCMGVVIIPILFVAVFNFLMLNEILSVSRIIRKNISNSLSLPSNVKDLKGSKTMASSISVLELSRIKQDQSISKTLLTITFAFVILLTFQCISQCFWMLHFQIQPEEERDWRNRNLSYVMARLTVVSHCLINSFLYCFTGTLFRRTLTSLFVSNRSSPSLPYSTR